MRSRRYRGAETKLLRCTQRLPGHAQGDINTFIVALLPLPAVRRQRIQAPLCCRNSSCKTRISQACTVGSRGFCTFRTRARANLSCSTISGDMPALDTSKWRKLTAIQSFSSPQILAARTSRHSNHSTPANESRLRLVVRKKLNSPQASSKVQVHIARTSTSESSSTGDRPSKDQVLGYSL